MGETLGLRRDTVLGFRVWGLGFREWRNGVFGTTTGDPV